MAELRKRRTSLNRAVVVNQDADFDELFKDLEEVREAVARELKEINGGGGRGGHCIKLMCVFGNDIFENNNAAK